MRRRHIFVTSSDLINQAVTEYHALKNALVPAGNVPRAVMQLSVKYEKILEKNSADPRLGELAEFLNEKEKYAAELKRYLLDLKQDIADTKWKIAVNLPDNAWDLELISDSSDEEEYITISDHGTWKWEPGLPRAVYNMKTELEVIAEEQLLDAQKTISIFDKIRCLMDELGKEKHPHAETSVFYRCHCDEIASLNFIPVGNKQLQLSASE